MHKKIYHVKLSINNEKKKYISVCCSIFKLCIYDIYFNVKIINKNITFQQKLI